MKTQLDGIFVSLLIVSGVFISFTLIATEFELAKVHENPHFWMMSDTHGSITGYTNAIDAVTNKNIYSPESVQARFVLALPSKLTK